MTNKKNNENVSKDKPKIKILSVRKTTYNMMNYLGKVDSNPSKKELRSQDSDN